ncbi:MAG: hypothetical protein JNL69_10860 [Bacteroidia bacterium]|nr:hypothetical protein [Bacteroidia bacterium]
MNIYILDEKNLIAESLKISLDKTFGENIRIFIFSDLDNCIRVINEKSHIIILDYLSNKNETLSGMKMFNEIKSKRPNSSILIISSQEELNVAEEKMYRNTNLYIKNNLRFTLDIRPMLRDNFYVPLNKIIIKPFKKILREYSVIKFVFIFLTAFVSVGLVVIIGSWLWSYFII